MKKSKIFLFLILLFTLQSCGVFNKVFKTKDKTKENTEVVVKKEEDSKVVDKSKTTVIEKKDTIISTKPKTINNGIPIIDLRDLNDLIVLKDDLVEVRQTYDSLSKTLKTQVNLMPQDFPIVIDKITITENDITHNVSKRQDSLSKKDIIQKSTVKEKEPVNVFWYVVIALAIIIAGYFLIKIKK